MRVSSAAECAKPGIFKAETKRPKDIRQGRLHYVVVDVMTNGVKRSSNKQVEGSNELQVELRKVRELTIDTCEICHVETWAVRVVNAMSSDIFLSLHHHCFIYIQKIT